MRIGRTLPPAAALLEWRGLGHAVAAMWSAERAVQMREDEIKTHFGVPYACLVSSGTAALTIALASLKDLSDRTAVVMPAFTCYSVAAAVLKARLRPVLCDVNPRTLDFDYDQLEQTLTDNTLCVVAHHLFGVPSNIERIRSLCHARGIYLVEDAAQAMGVQVNGGHLGVQGDVGIFSFSRGKNVTCGSGGAIVTRNESIAENVDRRCRRLEQPPRARALAQLLCVAVMAVFIRPSLYWLPAALPFLRLGETIFPENIPLYRLSGVQAGLLSGWRLRLTSNNRIRSNNASDLSWRLSQRPPCGPRHPYLRLPVLASTPRQRKRICDESCRLGLGMGVAYPRTIDQLPQLKGYLDATRFPGATTLAKQLLTVPTHHWVSEREKRVIAECFAAATSVLPTESRRTASSVEAAHHG